jgi:serine/threonine protein phosphatase 1
MKRLIAIGDIHGQLDMLKLLLEKVQPTAADKLIFIGDYIDRGPDSKGVVNFLLDFKQHFNAVFLRGNHEDMLLAFLGQDPNAHYGEAYLYNGGEHTVRSYAGENATFTDLKNAIPESHLEFFKQLKYYHIEEEFLFVHAGIVPGIPIEKQRTEDLIWIREEFLYSETGIGKIVVFGHTPLRSPLITNDKIGIDTGAGYNMRLSAIELHTKKLFSVSYQEARQRLKREEL